MMIDRDSSVRRILFRCLCAAGWIVTISSLIEGQLDDEFSRKLVDAALERTGHRVIYDSSYRTIDYPGGDVPLDRGVCTDVIVRSYRALGIDLQKEVHEDMKSAFHEYPDIWGLYRPDHSIDHRRVRNLRVFFERKGTVLPVTEDADDYKPGDLVAWVIPGNLPHIGIVTDSLSQDRVRPMIVHNIGRGPKLEDVLFEFEITGHYRYEGVDEQRR